ncbi:MAG TPA: protein translocase subunit SecD, partial [bacterium]|nr:protein translocase subunit SecD [bacterium]
MIKSKNVRAVIIVICAALSLFALWPSFKFYNLSDAQKKEMLKTPEGTKELNELQSKSINLGLDLKGGIHLVMETDVVTLYESIAK